MGSIEKTKEEIRNKIDIVDYLKKDGISLKQTGSTHTAACPNPTHDDTKASFHVYQDTQSFHCFGK